jgi:transcriptional regulator with XRE-family HTH domain
MLQKKGVSQRQLAGRLGVTEARVSQILGADGNPTVKTLARIAAALDCAVVIRFERTKEQKRERLAAIGGALVDGVIRVLKATGEKRVPRQPLEFVPATAKPILMIGGPK